MPTPIYLKLEAVLHGPKVRAKLDEVTTKLHDRAAGLAGDGEDASEIQQTSGTRPGTHSPDGVRRPYGRVSAPVSWEFGGPNQTRLRLLGRAAAEL